MNKGKEARGKLIIVGSNSAELLELEKEVFDEIAFFVEPPIDKPGIGFILSGRDAEIRIMKGDKFTQRPFAIGLVCENGVLSSEFGRVVFLLR